MGHYTSILIMYSENRNQYKRHATATMMMLKVKLIKLRM